MGISKRILKIIFIILILIFSGITINIVYAEENSNTEIDIYMSRVVKDGVYYITSVIDPNYVIDVKGGSLDNEAELELHTKHKDTNQKFYIHYVGNGYYQIENIASTKTIEVKGGLTEIGTIIQQYDENNTSAQRWKIRKNIDGTYNFISECSGKAMDIQGGIIENETPIQQYTYNNSYSQRFKLEETEIFDLDVNNGIMLIRAKGDKTKQLDVTNCSPEEGTEVHLWTDTPTLAQRYQLERVGENEVRIRTAASGGYLKESKNEIGASVIQSGNSKTPLTDSDTWKVVYDKGIVFINKESGLALTINGDYVDGAKIEVNTKTDSEKQRFVVRVIDLIPTGYYNISSAYGTLMEVDNAGTTVGTNIKTNSESGENAQKFEIEFKGNGYKIKSPLSGLVVEVANESKDDGANVQLGTDTGALSQMWLPTIVDGGYLTFKNANSGLMLNVQDENKEPGANINQTEENNSDSQKWRLTSTEFIKGWVNNNGNWYCYDPQTGELIKNTTRVDPMMQDPAQYGSIYDFDSEGKASWHLPTADDLPGGTGPSAPIPTVTGDRRQRVIQMALSRLGCPYVLGGEPTGFVCDGLTSWSYSTAIESFSGDASWQWELIKNHNGLKYNLNEFKPGDFVFFGDSALTEGGGKLTYENPYHAGIYYKDGIMINAVLNGGVCFWNISDYYLNFLGGGSPYGTETSRVEIPR